MRTRPVAKVAGPSSEREKEKERSGANEKETGKASVVEVKIRESVIIPDGHVWINEQLRIELGINQDSTFELLKLVLYSEKP